MAGAGVREWPYEEVAALVGSALGALGALAALLAAARALVRVPTLPTPASLPAFVAVVVEPPFAAASMLADDNEETAEEPGDSPEAGARPGRRGPSCRSTFVDRSTAACSRRPAPAPAGRRRRETSGSAAGA